MNIMINSMNIMMTFKSTIFIIFIYSNGGYNYIKEFDYNY